MRYRGVKHEPDSDTQKTWQSRWLYVAEHRGHVLKRGDDGEIDLFAGVSTHGHNGPLCLRCDWAVCMHCLSGPSLIPRCEAKRRRKTRAQGERQP